MTPKASKRTRLIFYHFLRHCEVCAGRIWQDAQTIGSYEPKDGVVVHCLNNPQRDAPASDQTLAPANPMSQMMGAAAPQTTSGDPFSQMVAQTQQQMVNNPEMMQQLMNSPMFQQMMSNPEMLRAMVRMNPQLNELMEQRPEIARMLEDPELLQQSLRMVANPSLMREMTRNADRALGQLDAMPGGHNALVRAHEEFADPLFEAMAGGSSNPSSAPVDYSQDTSTTPNNEALPNPWGPPPSTGSTPHVPSFPGQGPYLGREMPPLTPEEVANVGLTSRAGMMPGFTPPPMPGNQTGPSAGMGGMGGMPPMNPLLNPMMAMMGGNQGLGGMGGGMGALNSGLGSFPQPQPGFGNMGGFGMPNMAAMMNAMNAMGAMGQATSGPAGQAPAATPNPDLQRVTGLHWTLQFLFFFSSTFEISGFIVHILGTLKQSGFGSKLGMLCVHPTLCLGEICLAISTAFSDGLQQRGRLPESIGTAWGPGRCGHRLPAFGGWGWWQPLRGLSMELGLLSASGWTDLRLLDFHALAIERINKVLCL